MKSVGVAFLAVACSLPAPTLKTRDAGSDGPGSGGSAESAAGGTGGFVFFPTGGTGGTSTGGPPRSSAGGRLVVLGAGGGGGDGGSMPVVDSGHDQPAVPEAGEPIVPEEAGPPPVNWLFELHTYYGGCMFEVNGKLVDTDFYEVVPNRTLLHLVVYPNSLDIVRSGWIVHEPELYTTKALEYDALVDRNMRVVYCCSSPDLNIAVGSYACQI